MGKKLATGISAKEFDESGSSVRSSIVNRSAEDEGKTQAISFISSKSRVLLI